MPRTPSNIPPTRAVPSLPNPMENTRPASLLPPAQGATPRPPLLPRIPSAAERGALITITDTPSSTANAGIDADLRAYLLLPNVAAMLPPADADGLRISGTQAYADIESLGTVLVSRNPSDVTYVLPFVHEAPPGPKIELIPGSRRWRRVPTAEAVVARPTSLLTPDHRLPVAPSILDYIQAANMGHLLSPPDAAGHRFLDPFLYVDMDTGGSVRIARVASGDHHAVPVDEVKPLDMSLSPLGPAVEKIPGSFLWRRKAIKRPYGSAPEPVSLQLVSPRYRNKLSAPDMNGIRKANSAVFVTLGGPGLESGGIVRIEPSVEGYRARLDNERQACGPLLEKIEGERTWRVKLPTPGLIAPMPLRLDSVEQLWRTWKTTSTSDTTQSLLVEGFHYPLLPTGTQQTDSNLYIQNTMSARYDYDSFESLLVSSPQLQPRHVIRQGATEPWRVSDLLPFSKPIKDSIAQIFPDLSEDSTQSIARNLFNLADHSTQLTGSAIDVIKQTLYDWETKSAPHRADLADPLLMLRPPPRPAWDITPLPLPASSSTGPLQRLAFDMKSYSAQWDQFALTHSGKDLKKLITDVLHHNGYKVYPPSAEKGLPALVVTRKGLKSVFFIKLSRIRSEHVQLFTIPGSELADPLLAARIGTPAMNALRNALASNNIVWLLGGTKQTPDGDNSIFIMAEPHAVIAESGHVPAASAQVQGRIPTTTDVPERRPAQAGTSTAHVPPVQPEVLTIKPPSDEDLPSSVTRHRVDNTLPILQDPDNPSISKTLEVEGPVDQIVVTGWSKTINLLRNKQIIDGVKKGITDQVREWIRTEGAHEPAFASTLDAQVLLDSGPDRGLSVFAKRDIPMYEVIGPYAGKLHPDDASLREEVRRKGLTAVTQYLFNTDSEAVVSAHGSGNTLSLINTAKLPGTEAIGSNNVESIRVGHNLTFIIAKRPIKTGEELLLDYGTRYDPDQGRTLVKQE